jgi:hypothetical protein
VRHTADLTEEETEKQAQEEKKEAEKDIFWPTARSADDWDF